MISLELRIDEKRFPGRTAPVLKALAFDVEAGEFVALVGPSGAGKSTLLNLIAGLDVDYRGRIVRHGEGDGSELAFVFQEPRLMPWLTARENVGLVLDQGDAQDPRVDAVLSHVGLLEHADVYPARLSGGMQRRVALARAFVVRPRLLLLDEPFVSLDGPTATRLRGYLKALAAAFRPTVIFVTHDLSEALALADRVLFFSRAPAQVVRDLTVPLGSPRDVDSPAVRALCDRLLASDPHLLAGIATAVDTARKSDDEREERQA
jgi:NitT/TauT family transport system ATP-binding protein